MTQHISATLKTKIKGPTGDHSSTLCPRATDVVNKLFALFLVCCRGFEKFYAADGRLNAEKTQWIRVFMEDDFTDLSKIERGVKRLRRESPINPPTIKEFLEWNKVTTEELGLPDVEVAYKQAIKNSHPSEVNKVWDHEAVHFAWRKTGARQLLTQPEKETFKRFKYYYEIAVDKLTKGESLCEVKPAIGHDKRFYMDGISLPWRGKNPLSYYVCYKVAGGFRDHRDFIERFDEKYKNV